MRVLITGGAGFVGSHLARSFQAQDSSTKITVLDNLRRRGSELNLPDFKKRAIPFVHGDIRCPSDLEDLDGSFDVLIESSAEPSVLAGLTGSPRYLLDTNLSGTMNCLEFARKRAGAFVFLSTSRVYSMAPLKEIALEETADRFEISPKQTKVGLSVQGISERFPTDTARSLYGATKLSSEMLVQEYSAAFGLKSVINRCGVIAGPGQFGKVDQGVFTLWVAHHYFKRPLRYTGFGGTGKQVRDLLHPADLFDLISKQIQGVERLSGEIYNIGGGRGISVSMRELTGHCQSVIGNTIEIGSLPESSPVDIPLFICDSSLAGEKWGWKPQKSVREIVVSIRDWIRANEAELKPLFT